MTDDESPNASGIVHSLGQCATLACLFEVTAPKPGNVYRGADFEDLTFADFLISSTVIGPVFEAADSQDVGEMVLHAVRVTQGSVGTNTNLGTVLLLAPLAKASGEAPLREGLAEVLNALGPSDAKNVYQAICEAQAGGLGKVKEADVAGDPPDDLIGAMRLAADRDLVARQFVNGFQEVLDAIVPDLRHGIAQGWALSDSIVWTHIHQLSRQPDSLIARKCGLELAQEASDRAAAVLSAGEMGESGYLQALADFDFWLRADGHRRNPGTTADLIAAGLFVCLREGFLKLPTLF